ncbi:hypothetical protein C8Q80DRAFT_302957 [Daedaleopsis nitida]|nr:hypothetical protein C8Q80DRAFT_302957 [Daedaleopsis nitida]
MSTTSTTIDDSDSQVTYFPDPSNWHTNSLENAYDGTVHSPPRLKEHSGSAKLSFTGTGIELLGFFSGGTVPANLNCTVDDVPLQFVDLSHPTPYFTFCSKSGLRDGLHTFQFLGPGQDEMAQLSLDAFVVYTTLPPSSPPTTTSSIVLTSMTTTSESSPPPDPSPAPTITGSLASSPPPSMPTSSSTTSGIVSPSTLSTSSRMLSLTGPVTVLVSSYFGITVTESNTVIESTLALSFPISTLSTTGTMPTSSTHGRNNTHLGVEIGVPVAVILLLLIVAVILYRQNRRSRDQRRKVREALQSDPKGFARYADEMTTTTGPPMLTTWSPELFTADSRSPTADVDYAALRSDIQSLYDSTASRASSSKPLLPHEDPTTDTGDASANTALARTTTRESDTTPAPSRQSWHAV